MDIGTRIKNLRKNLSLTQKEVAKELQISQQALGDWENKKKLPTADKIDKIANFFNVSTDYLLGNSDSRNPEEEIDLSDFEILYRNTSKGLSDDEQAQLEIDLKNFLIERQKVIQERQKAKASDKLS